MDFSGYTRITFDSTFWRLQSLFKGYYYLDYSDRKKLSKGYV